jgi:serine O-acetyltransferase
MLRVIAQGIAAAAMLDGQPQDGYHLLSSPKRDSPILSIGKDCQRQNPVMDELTEYLLSNAEDGFWEQIQAEARREAEREPVLVSFLFASVLRHRNLEDAFGAILANKMQTPDMQAILLRDLVCEALAADGSIRAAIRADLLAARTRDPAARGYAMPFLYFKGFHALQAYRVAHWLWMQGRRALAAHLQNRISEAFGLDIHPAARIGSGVLIDHGTGVVIGETAVVEDNVSLLHEVTLGGTGKEMGDRHPKVRRGVLIGAGAKILGNIEIGSGAKIAAGSVVLRDVPPHVTVAGIPARVVGRCTVAEPALEMDATFPCEAEGGAGI